MRMHRLLTVLLLASLGCGAHAPGPGVAPAGRARPVVCLDAAQSLVDLAPLERIIDITERAASQAPVETVLVENACWKRAYRRGRYRMVVWLDAVATRRWRMFIAPDPQPTAACVADAEVQARRLLPYAETILSKARRIFGAEWPDPDIGAGSYIECTANQYARLRSLDMLLHELNHRLTDRDCLHEPTSGTPLCFGLPGLLPPRSIAKIDLGALDEGVALLLRPLQENYLGVNDGGPLSLFDELMAYRITTDVEAALFEQRGAAIAAPRGKQQVMYLSVFMYYAARYVLALHERDPALHRTYFGHGSANLVHLLHLLDLCEESYRHWRRVLAAAKHHPHAIETELWRRYQAARGALAALDAPAGPRGR
jgi:hypothetical protein